MRYGGWANLLAFVAGLALGVLLCGTGHATVVCTPGATGARCVDDRLPYHPQVSDPSFLQCVVRENEQDRWVPCDEAWLIRKDAEPPCLAQMEAAMRAMEPYSAILSTEENYERRKEALMDRESARRVLKQWEQSKRDCWRQP